MHYSGSFEVSASIEEVYSFLVDPKKMAAVLPDVEQVEKIDENNFKLTANVGISFIKGRITAKMTVVERRPPKYAKLIARGSGVGSSVDIETSFTLQKRSKEGTLVNWVADAMVGGMMMSVGSRLIEPAAQKYVKQIISSLQEKLNR